MASNHYYPTDEVYKVNLTVDVKLERLTDYYLTKPELENFDRAYVQQVIHGALVGALTRLHEDTEILDRVDVVEWSVAKVEVKNVLE